MCVCVSVCVYEYIGVPSACQFVRVCERVRNDREGMFLLHHRRGDGVLKQLT